MIFLKTSQSLPHDRGSISIYVINRPPPKNPESFRLSALVIFPPRFPFPPPHWEGRSGVPAPNYSTTHKSVSQSPEGNTFAIAVFPFLWVSPGLLFFGGGGGVGSSLNQPLPLPLHRNPRRGGGWCRPEPAPSIYWGSPVAEHHGAEQDENTPLPGREGRGVGEGRRRALPTTPKTTNPKTMRENIAPNGINSGIPKIRKTPGKYE